MSEVEPLYAALGANVRRLRERKGWTQNELALMLDPPVTRASVSNLEKGNQRVYTHTLLQLRRLFGCSVHLLLRRSVR